MLRNVKRYLDLERADRRTLRRAYIWLAMTDIALRTVGLARLVRRLRIVDPHWGGVGADAPYRAWRYAHWLDVASRHHVVRARCLHRSLVLNRWLLREGIPSHLRIGVRKEGRALHAHAWVELGGRAVYEHPDALTAFVPLVGPLLPPVPGAPIGKPIAAVDGQAKQPLHGLEVRA